MRRPVTDDTQQTLPAHDQPSSGLICQVDHVVCTSQGIFGFGWALDPVHRIVAGKLRLHHGPGRVDSVRVSLGRAREDVAMAFAQHPQAAHAGLMFMAGWADQAPESIELVIELDNGHAHSLDLLSTAERSTQRAGLSEKRYLFKRVVAHIRKRQFTQLLYKGLRHVRSNPRLASADDRALAARLKGRRCRLMIDHSMGGGANLFRERQVSAWLADGDTVVLLSQRVASLTTFVEVRDRAGSLVQTLTQLDSLADIVADTQLLEVFYNCAVSFPQPYRVRNLLLDLKRRHAARLTVVLHDYFLLCPSHFLLDRSGVHCGVPALEHCAGCLREHDDGFVSLTGERSIGHWRALWGELLHAADEVRCFSESSRHLLARAYPQVAERATLRPHALTPLRAVRGSGMRPSQAPLTIGVIGAISQHKGAGVVADLARAIEASAAQVRIVVIGSLDAPCPPEIVSQTGVYQPDDLPNLIEKHQVNIALFPSICPETFSFVVHEIVAMKLPFLCLDLGAQAEVARSHPNGRVSPRQDGAGLLEALLAFDRQLHPLQLKVLV